MTTRTTDMADQQQYYDLNHKVNDIAKDMENLKERVKEDHTNLKTAIKDLADSQKELAESINKQSISMAKLESALSTIARSVTWFFPILVTIITLVVGGVWTYTQSSKTTQIANPPAIINPRSQQ